jgi:hypothetical protein
MATMKEILLEDFQYNVVLWSLQIIVTNLAIGKWNALNLCMGDNMKNHAKI